MKKLMTENTRPTAQAVGAEAKSGDIAQGQRGRAGRKQNFYNYRAALQQVAEAGQDKFFLQYIINLNFISL